ncbi:MOSC domain-containing protein [Asticcacaulis sp. 201]|uniref:MOSC domain-containing protein n=1 Tax=Asticcacaulis sp. 201 TaxID=3028787 RepID=UPI0029167365|nr:MOSC N-terminal beta barrel domain-containing protein [Asticcacaulis sp. 201]MDV6332459.1 MOSC domain-containing protein [Asticcacaulis sp. 201]
MTQSGVISALWRHPVKGFTPEPVNEALLCPDGFFPFDRLYALEVGRSGFDPVAPKTISKMKFAVLARFAAVARLRTRYDEFADVLDIVDEDGKTWRFDMASDAGRHSLARHVETVLARHEDYDPAAFPLTLLSAPDPEVVRSHFRFTDSGKGFVSFLNLNSLRDLGQRIGRDLDPLRLRANIWVEDQSAFEDHDWAGKHIRLGAEGPEFEVLKPIVRCVATHVNPDTAERDVDLCAALWEQYGHRDCGIYARVIKGGTARPGDALHVY